MSVAAPRRCGDCDALLAERQRWCVACGAAPGIALAPAPRWGARAAATAVLVALALVGVAVVLATVL